MATTIFTPQMLRNGTRAVPEIPAGGGGGFTNTYSLDFDGVDDYIDCGDSDGFSFGNGVTDSPFSISAWINMDNASKFRIASKYTSTTKEYIFTTSGTSLLSFVLYDNSSGGRIQRKYNTALTSFQGEWINVIGTYDGSSSSSGIKIYLNGTRVDDIDGNAGSYVAMENTTQPFEIGRNDLTSFANGKIDELSVFNSELSASDITDLYNSGQPTDLTDLSPLAWYRMGDNGSYKSPQWLIPNNENKDKVSNYSFEFDGADDYVELGSLSNLQNATEYSISSWFKSPLNNQYQAIYSWFDGADGYLQLLLVDDGSFVVYNYRTSSAYGVSASGLVSANTWYNALVVFDGSGATNADRLKLYINGSLITLTYTGTIPTQTGTMLSNGLHAGARVTTSGAYVWGLEGNIDEVSIFDSAISIGDVWDGSGEPIDVSAVSGLKQYYKMGEEANFTSNWLVDNSALSNYSKRSFQFDGIDDYVSVSDNSIGQTQNISYSIWVNLDVTTDQWIIGNQSSSNGGAGLAVKAGALIFQMADGTNDSYFNSRVASFSTYAPINTWNHILATWDGTDSKIYINGVLRNTWSPTLPYTIIGFRGTFNIGWRAAGFAQMTNGKLDELALFDSGVSIGDVWDGSGQPIDVSAVSGITNNWRMGEDASFNGTNWTIPDNVGSSTGTSANMTVDDLVGEAPNYSGGGISSGMTIEDRVGEAPNSENNALSYNMVREDRVEDVPS